MPSSPDPKSFIEDIAKINPHQLAPTVGTLGVGVMNSTAFFALNHGATQRLTETKSLLVKLIFDHTHPSTVLCKS
jgi:hypothetical protein